MATLKQEAAVKELVESGGASVSKAMRESKHPYSPKTAKTPKKLTGSKGYKEELAKYGLTPKLVTSSLVEDIKAKPQKRVSELALGAEILRMKGSDGRGDVNINLIQPILVRFLDKENENS